MNEPRFSSAAYDSKNQPNNKYVFHAIHLHDEVGTVNVDCPDCINLIHGWVTHMIRNKDELPVTFHLGIGPKMENLKITVEREK